MTSRNRGQAPPPESVPPMTAMPPTASETAKHAYQVMQVTMRPERPLTFSCGERVVAVLASEQEPLSVDWRVTVLVEMP